MTEPSASRDLILQADARNPRAGEVLRALASEPRLRILELLSDQLLNTSEIAAALGLPLSTATLHIGILEAAGLLLTERKPAVRGSQKVCARAIDTLHVRLPQARRQGAQTLEISMPVGAYTDLRAVPSCGLASEEGIIGLFDDPTSFFEPERLRAQLLWFHHGYAEYRFPNRVPAGATLESLSVSFEVCSEAPLHHVPWPSDITVWLNGLELGSWTSPGDFGGQRGHLTPDWWEDRNSQFGLLKVFSVTQEGAFVDGVQLSELTLHDLGLHRERFIAVRIGVKENAHHVGGLNLFGRRFGNYPQDIVLQMRYT
jgi:predicted transcriptional regulator